LNYKPFKNVLSGAIFLTILGSIFGVFSLPLYADDNTTEEVGMWLPVNLEIPITEKLSVTTEPQFRWVDKGRHANQQQWRNALNYQINDTLEVSVGHMWTARHAKGEELFSDRTTYENRLYQDLNIKHPPVRLLGKLKVDHRLRLEERLLRDIEDPIWYGRYRLRMAYPLGKTKTAEGKPLSPKTQAVQSSELLVHINRVDTTAHGLVQQRYFLGVNHKLNKHMNVDAGYMLVLGDQLEESKGNFINHLLLIQLNIKPDFKKDVPSPNQLRTP
jgi:hypothetical protein